MYPYYSPVILDDTAFVAYGGAVGTFTLAQRTSSYLMAEMFVSKYIGTLLVPTIVTGTFPYMGSNRIVTDYGYVHRILDVAVLSKDGLSSSCVLKSESGCAFIYDDTFGYLDFKKVLSSCGIGCCADSYGMAAYQIQVSYEAGLTTGTSTQPGILEALTILAQIDLNEKSPGNSGMNEGVGDVGITQFSDLGSRGYTEQRKPADMKRTIFGSSPKANYAARLIDATIRKARPALRL